VVPLPEPTPTRASSGGLRGVVVPLPAGFTPSQSARYAALIRWSREDPKVNAERGQAGLQAKFYNQTDPSLPEAERQRRAYAAYRAHMVAIRAQRPRRPQPGGDVA
jgi:hypothetical protein